MTCGGRRRARGSGAGVYGWAARRRGGAWNKENYYMMTNCHAPAQIRVTSGVKVPQQITDL